MKNFKQLLFLSSIKRVGKKTIYNKYWNILNTSPDFDDLVKKMKHEKSEDLIDDALKKSENIYNQVIDSDIHVITVFDDDYPEKLNMLEDKRPLILFIKGNPDALNKANIAFIGTRKPSKISEEFENSMVKAVLNATDRVIVSGLALGCDKIAHKATVDENKITIAVLPSGVNVITPASNKKLAEEIIETGGCLVSEYNPDAKANKGSYVERDNVVAAFSDAVFVVECGVKSGTMHTVNFANDYGKPVYTYLPDERPEGSFDGNEYILENNGIEVNDFEEFITDLETLKQVNNSKSVQTTLC